jgi:hypothetical protein
VAGIKVKLAGVGVRMREFKEAIRGQVRSVSLLMASTFARGYYYSCSAEWTVTGETRTSARRLWLPAKPLVSFKCLWIPGAVLSPTRGLCV